MALAVFDPFPADGQVYLTEMNHKVCQKMINCQFKIFYVSVNMFSTALLLRGKVNISQLQGEIEFKTFLCDKPYN